MRRASFGAFLLAWSAALPTDAAEPSSGLRVSFSRDIRPILSQNCFQCHGPDAKARKARLRLDQRRDAVADRRGHAAVVPGKAESSEVLARVLSDNPAEQMPPSKSGKRLAAHEIRLLRDWINQGAPYEGFWAFEPLAQRPVPSANGCVNPIDAFVAAKLAEQGLAWSPEATPEALLRRVTLDLTGLPPTVGELEAFLADLHRPSSDREACYQRVVDRLLSSPHFGEHMAVGWLDAARYADTNGYFSDKPRQMWLWRDWVIDAFNENMPFDQFTIEQLAGDLLPNATVRQRIASGFNRNHIANNETGIIDEEFRVEYVVDRVHTTMTVWQGLTAGCAQCHDHKFDPISQREFYSLFAFFNNVPEKGLIVADNPPPVIAVPSPEQQRRRVELAAESRAAADAFSPIHTRLKEDISLWTQTARDSLPHPPARSLVLHEAFDGTTGAATTAHGTTFVYEGGVRGKSAKFDGTQHVEARLGEFNADGAWTLGLWILADGSLGCPLSLIEPTGRRRGIEVLWAKGHMKVNLVDRWGVSALEVSTAQATSSKEWHHVVIRYDGSHRAKGLAVFVDGKPETLDVRLDTLQGTVTNAEPLRIGRRDEGLGFYGRIDELRLVQESLDDKVIGDWYWRERVRGILERAPSDRDARDADVLLDYYLARFGDAAAQAAHRRVKTAARALSDLRAAIPTALVMQEMASPRVTHILQRGQYDKPGDVVQPGVPSAIAPWPHEAPRNRLGFARWLVSAHNPLTQRVAVNRLWQQVFGEGLVLTVDDFGSQGEPPTHPELLDWLAATFRDNGWDVKAILRLMVTCRTYRQQSRYTIAKGHVIDRDNRLLGRGPSHRLSAEMLRDQALALSGLLVPKIGGPSVKPYQPPGLWEAVSYNAEETYAPDTSAGLWRRSLYTYVKRQAPPPALLNFDGPTREKCTMRRPRTNTPLQALQLLNDETFVEAARALAARSLRAAGNNDVGQAFEPDVRLESLTCTSFFPFALRDSEPDEIQLARLFRAILLRPAQPEEIDLLGGLLRRQRQRFAGDQEAAKRLLAVGAAKYDQRLNVDELAAWTIVAHTLLNLDETVTKR